MVSLVLLEKVSNLGQIGDKVKVKPGYARNFLLPQGKALRATKENIEKFEKIRVNIENKNIETRKEAEVIKEKLDSNHFLIIRSASDTGSLYGSVTSKDISECINKEGFKIDRKQIILNKPIKELGIHKLELSLHPEVNININLNVARSLEEAELQKKGEDKTSSGSVTDDKGIDNSKLFDKESDAAKILENPIDDESIAPAETDENQIASEINN